MPQWGMPHPAAHPHDFTGPRPGIVAGAMPKKPKLDLAGTLQAEVMRILWDVGPATVDEVRAHQSGQRRSAYTTVQTVLNRLHDRGLLDRERRGKAFVYSPRQSEPELLARAIGQRLAGSSTSVRRAALLNLVDELDAEELEELSRYANRVRRARRDR